MVPWLLIFLSKPNSHISNWNYHYPNKQAHAAQDISSLSKVSGPPQ